MRFEVYCGEDRQYYWRLRSANSQVIATGAEGYTRRRDARRAIRRVLTGSYWIVEDHFDRGQAYPIVEVDR